MDLDLIWFNRTTDVPDTFWDACFPLPREGLFWFRALEKGILDDQFTFQFGLLRRGGTNIGIVPIFVFDLPLELVIPPEVARFVLPLARGPLRRFAFQRTLFVGNVAGEEGAIGLLPGLPLGDFARFIHAELRAKAVALGAPMIVWKEFPTSERVALDTLLGTGRIFRMVSYPGTSIPLVPGGYRAFLGTLRSDRRWKINDKLRRGSKKIAVVPSIVAHPSQRELGEIFALFLQTYRRGKTKFEKLTPEFFDAIAQSEQATFVVLRDAASAKMLAFMLMLNLGQRVINQFIGMDYASATGGFLYFRLFAEAYDWACTTSATAVQSGQTGYMAKLDMGHTLVPLWNYCEHCNPIINWVYKKVSRTIRWETLDDQLGEYLTAHPEARPLA